MARLQANMNFLENDCMLEQNARKQTPLKIQFYFQVNIILPTSTISKAKKRHCFFSCLILTLCERMRSAASAHCTADSI